MLTARTVRAMRCVHRLNVGDTQRARHELLLVPNHLTHDALFVCTITLCVCVMVQLMGLFRVCVCEVTWGFRDKQCRNLRKLLTHPPPPNHVPQSSGSLLLKQLSWLLFWPPSFALLTRAGRLQGQGE